MGKERKGRTGRTVCIACTAVILIAAIALSVLAGVFSETLDEFVVGYREPEETSEYAKGLAEQMQGEGTVLVRNENGTLPLSKDVTKVNVFGWDSIDWVISGSGSGQVKYVKGRSVDLLGALDAYGISYNTEITDMYRSFQSSREYSDHGGQGSGGNTSIGSLHSFNYEFSRLYEPSIKDTDYYTESMLSSAKAFSDTAIVCIGRVSGESNDSPKVQYKRTTKNGAIQTDDTRTYLEISAEEQELLTYVGANYGSVIVLINSTNVMELGFLETIPGLDACLIVSTTGTYGANVIPEMLYGDATPSGRTADTWAYDLTTSATYANTGSGNDTTNFYTNGAGLYPTTVTHTNGSYDVAYEGVAYEDYQEGIYVGYKWYETADAEGFWDTQYAKTQWGIRDGYKDVVQYPFGYGLSYTDFSWTVSDVSPADGTLTRDGTVSVQVTVKNTGSYAGQDTVELYYSAPYTKGGVEKSSVCLGAYAKTGTLEPGDEETVTLSMPVRDMASYDCYNLSGAVGSGGGCILEKGTYTLTLRTDAHSIATGRMAEDAGSATVSLAAADDILYTEDSATGNTVSNVFTGTSAADGVAIDGNSDGTADITYLTRADFTGTFPAEMTSPRAMTEAVQRYNLYTQEQAEKWDESHATDTVYAYGDLSRGGDIAVKNEDKTYSLTDLGNAIAQDYSADEWESVLGRMSWNEMEDLVLHGYTKTAAVSSIGKPKTKDADGPNQIGSFMSSYGSATGFSAIVLAQTWNTSLAYEMGLAVGEECAVNGVSGWYGPACNIHRSPFGGRNFEYYSEDAHLSGDMCASTVRGAKNRGVFCYLKHMCLYESESGRDGMYIWLTEQALREIYIKPFEIAVKEGGATGIMSSYGRIGAVWTGGSEGLLTDVLRTEWGFEGCVLTDYADHQQFMNADQMVRAGGNLWMDGWLSDGAFMYDTSSAAFQGAMRSAAKGIIYMWADALHANAAYNALVASGEIQGNIVQVTEGELSFRWYIPVIAAVDVIAVAGCAFWIWRRFFRRPKA
ncbi:MAG: glycoside hydrolase family 3 C-terminal domain-containing protein [Clostridia bacterium]|nr:glycoside hydrolase family 3 C-terminal domain-containing protein [Clostridia bacterium]